MTLPSTIPHRHVYVVGGRQRSDASLVEEWHAYEAGVIARVDLESGDAEPLVSYQSPPEACPDDRPSFVFKAGCCDDRVLRVCTQTEVLGYELPTMRQAEYLSLPCFNDLHHVKVRENGNLLVVSTGLDMLLEVDPRGRRIREWNATDEAPWTRFSRETDYRKVPTTKPHRAHPNYVFEFDGEIWLTRFEQRDAICVDDHSRRIAIDVERPHDGLVERDRIAFTTVDGHVVFADRQTLGIREVVEIGRFYARPALLGWCRSILPVGPDRYLVGFSRIRPTKFKANLRWLKQRVVEAASHESLPSRLVLVNLREGRIEREYPLEAAGVNAVFSIHPAPE